MSNNPSVIPTGFADEAANQNALLMQKIKALTGNAFISTADTRVASANRLQEVEEKSGLPEIAREQRHICRLPKITRCHARNEIVWGTCACCERKQGGSSKFVHSF